MIFLSYSSDSKKKESSPDALVNGLKRAGKNAHSDRRKFLAGDVHKDVSFNFFVEGVHLMVCIESH